MKEEDEDCTLDSSVKKDVVLGFEMRERGDKNKKRREEKKRGGKV